MGRRCLKRVWQRLLSAALTASLLGEASHIAEKLPVSRNPRDGMIGNRQPLHIETHATPGSPMGQRAMVFARP